MFKNYIKDNFKSYCINCNNELNANTKKYLFKNKPFKYVCKNCFLTELKSDIKYYRYRLSQDYEYNNTSKILCDVYDDKYSKELIYKVF